MIKIKAPREINLGVAKAGGDTRYNDLYGEAPPEMLSFWSLKKALKDSQMHVMAVIKAI